jgi:Tfp pilus assembly protein PilV
MAKFNHNYHSFTILEQIISLLLLSFGVLIINHSLAVMVNYIDKLEQQTINLYQVYNQLEYGENN